MSVFGGLVLTNNGRNLFAKAQTGKLLNFKRIVLGDGQLGSSESMINVLQLKNEILSCNILDMKIIQNEIAKITFVISNQELLEGFYWRELGIIAEDPDTKEEVLYCYGNARENGEYISAKGGEDILEKHVSIDISISNVENVSAIIDESLVFVSKKELQLFQQQQLDDMSKTYTGTNITGPTVEGYGTIHKLYGHTVEEGTGEKSPSNPYTLKCVGDDVNRYNPANIQPLSRNGITCTVKGEILTFNGVCTTDDTNFTVNFSNLIKNINGQTSIFIEYLSGNIQNSTDLTIYALFAQNYTHTIVGKLKTENMKSISNLADGINLAGMNIRFDSGVKVNNYTIRIKVSQINTEAWSPYGYGTIEIISQNGAQQSSNVVVAKPLCCLKDGDNIVAQDWIDYDKGVVHRECTYVVIDGSDDEIYTYVANNSNNNYTQINLNLKVLAKGESRMICSHFKYYSGATGADKAQARATIHNSNILVFSIPKTIALNVETFKAWLSSNPITLIYQLATPIEEPLNYSNKIAQYANETTVSNRDGAKIEVSLTNNKAISEVNRELGGLRDKTVTVDLISEITSDFGISTNRSQFKKVNDMYNLNLFIGSNTVFGNDITIANIPTKHTPNNIEFLQFPVMLQNLNSQVIGIGRASIKPNGQISLHHDVSNVYRIVLSATYIK